MKFSNFFFIFKSFKSSLKLKIDIKHGVVVEKYGVSVCFDNF